MEACSETAKTPREGKRSQIRGVRHASPCPLACRDVDEIPRHVRNARASSRRSPDGAQRRSASPFYQPERAGSASAGRRGRAEARFAGATGRCVAKIAAPPTPQECGAKSAEMAVGTPAESARPVKSTIILRANISDTPAITSAVYRRVPRTSFRPYGSLHALPAAWRYAIYSATSGDREDSDSAEEAMRTFGYAHKVRKEEEALLLLFFINGGGKRARDAVAPCPAAP